MPMMPRHHGSDYHDVQVIEPTFHAGHFIATLLQADYEDKYYADFAH